MHRLRIFSLLVCLLVLNFSAHAQTENASISGRVVDHSGAVIQKAEVSIKNINTNTVFRSQTNNDGIYSVPGIKPGNYVMRVQKQGFRSVDVTGLTLYTQDQVARNFSLEVGSASESITVDGSGLQINTTDGSVGTVIDRQFVANVPLNGRSFQDLISMSPGVVTASPQNNSSRPGSTGDFSINGQRTEANYYMVDGVAANVSAGPTTSGYGAAGVMATTSALGTTQSLLSVDALQEFRVQSSSYSAEYGRGPGGQLSFLTRSGTNDFHGSAYDYFRNGWFDANDWFNSRLHQPKQQLHMNDFGGTLGGPIWIPHLYQGRNKTFFFGSYEGLRMTQPVAASIQYVPDMYMRQRAPAAIQPILNAYPKPSPTGIDYGTPQAPSLAQFFQGYSVPGRIDSTSVRLDHTFTPALSVFFRFADTPSSSDSRSGSIAASGKMNAKTYTFGTTHVLTPAMTNQFRLGYSRSYSGSFSTVDSFGGATPVDLGAVMGSTNGITGLDQRVQFTVQIAGVGSAQLSIPANTANQHQWNLTDSLDVAHGKQHWKFGVDFRHIYTLQTPATVIMTSTLRSAKSVLTNVVDSASYIKSLSYTPVVNQFSLFVQDDWRITPRLSLSGGLRWEVAPPPHNATSPQPYTLIGNLNDPKTLTLAPAGTPLWHTAWYSLAPRLGIAWQDRTTGWT